MLRIAKWVAVLGIWLAITVGGVVAWYGADLPDVETALNPTRRPAITVLAQDGTELAIIGQYYGRPLTVAELPKAVAAAVIATEDRRFYEHFGVDVVGIGRALVANLRAGGVVQGGSTITQQAAKNLFLSAERTLKRKIQEVLLALWLERTFEKDQILAIYLNRAYFGAGAYGIDAAALKFFDRPATKLSTYQAALLVGLLKAPSRYNPIADPDAAATRAHEVIANMVEAGYLTEREAKAALQRGPVAMAATRGRQLGRHFVDWVIAQVPAFIGTIDRDLVVSTTLDSRLQRLAEDRAAELLDGPSAIQAGAGQVALVALSPTGAVRAMVGGRDYWQSPFNRAAAAFRQPGSAFKPIVYLAGLEAGLSTQSRMVDQPLSINGWSPRNFSGRHRGEVTLDQALAESINTVAVQVGRHAGLDRVVDVARRLGITADLQQAPSLALGTSEVSLTELTQAYAAIANGGQGVFAYGIVAIHDRSGKLVYDRSGSGAGRVLSRQNAAAMTRMLVDAVETGTGRAARFGRPIAGKTGTSQNYRDAWFVGFSADLVTGVWVGNDDDQPMKGVTGGGLPAQLWRAFMADAHAGWPVRPLPAQDVPAPSEPQEAHVAPTREPDLWQRLLRVFGG